MMAKPKTYGKQRNFRPGTQGYRLEQWLIQQGYLNDITGKTKYPIPFSIIPESVVPNKTLTANGCALLRSDGIVGQKYNITRYTGNNGVANVSFSFNGYYSPSQNHQAWKSGYPVSSQERIITLHRVCPITGVTSANNEVDHMVNRPDHKPDTDKFLFQPLAKCVNTAKRNHCNECAATNRRFDARTLGFKIGWTQGKVRFQPTPGCRGCYWFDPKEFHKKVSK